MDFNRIKMLTNARMAGEQLSYQALLPYFDAVIDELNADMHACFKTFSEINATGVGEPNVYEEFPDQYIRSVVCVGAAYKWYVDDEEGIDTAQALGMEYKNNKFVMLRDYGPLIPCKKQRHDHGGMLHDGHPPLHPRINPDLRTQEVVGPKGDSVDFLKLEDTDDGQLLMYRLSSQAQGAKMLSAGKIKIPGQKVIRKVSDVPEDGDFPNQIGYDIGEVTIKEQTNKDIINGFLENIGYSLSQEELKEEEEEP